jgi:hypothetical protein
MELCTTAGKRIAHDRCRPVRAGKDSILRRNLASPSIKNEHLTPWIVEIK